ncbi:MAG: hypothetical protein WC343_07475 [Bacilli bacterium]|jgi:hypothetical protein
MRIYETSEWRNDPPAQGEIFICPDEHRRCFPESWIVCKSTTCPCSNIITKGIFWNIEDATLFANALTASNTRIFKEGDVRCIKAIMGLMQAVTGQETYSDEMDCLRRLLEAAKIMESEE